MPNDDLRHYARLGLEAEIAKLQQKLHALLDSPPTPALPPAAPLKPHWTQTPEGRLRMRDVQRKSWETRKTTKAPTTTKAVKALKKR